jgi:hypothetical protein
MGKQKVAEGKEFMDQAVSAETKQFQTEILKRPKQIHSNEQGCSFTFCF